MMKKLVVTACLALGLTACGVESAEESSGQQTVEQQGIQPTGPYVCGMDDCPSGMCAVSTVPSSMCGTGYAFVCTTIVPGQTKCI